jgi:23S rRNA (guanine745-N1)-methyltransferase
MSGGGLSLVIDRLACPICQAAMSLDDGRVRCAHAHFFDVARQGYVSLLRGGTQAKTGDGAAMIAARAQFLGRGHYTAIAESVSAAIGDSAGLCIDLAGGTGYYLSVVLDDHADLIGLNVDLSSAALRRAARLHERMAAIAADVWQPLPIRSATAACVLSVFGPRNGAEIERVLALDGRLVTVTPTARHLSELVGGLGLVTVDPQKQSRLHDQLRGLARVADRAVEYQVTMSHQDVLDEVMMGPSSHHVDPAVLSDQVARWPTALAVTVSVSVSVWARP